MHTFIYNDKMKEEAQVRYLVEGVHERRPVTRKDVQVAVPGFDEGGEQAGAVHALAFGEDRLHIGEIVHGEVECFHTAVLGGIHKVDHLYVVFQMML